MKYLLSFFITLFTLSVFAQSNTFPSSGNVGIGTTTGLERALNIRGEGIRLLSSNNTSGGEVGATGYHSTLTLSSNLYYTGSGAPESNINYLKDAGGSARGGALLYLRANSNSHRGLYFYTAEESTGPNTSAVLTERLRIRDNGNTAFMNSSIGIGTISPAEKLHIYSNVAGQSEAIKVESKQSAGLELISDRSNLSGEPGGAYVYFSQDNKLVTGVTGLLQSAGEDPRREPYTGTTSNSMLFGSYSTRDLHFGTDSKVRMTVDGSDGYVGIGTDDPDEKLTVAGTVKSREVIVEENTGADFVFEEDYDLPTLSELEAFIMFNKHLPDIPTASQMRAEGVKVGELQMKLLQKIEELTLYAIEQKKRDTQKDEIIKKLIQRIEQLESEKEAP